MIVYVVKWESALAFLVWGEVKMELRRPTLADKETILSMVAEFEETQSAHDGGFWDAEAFVYEAWWKWG